jgi:hypothetical protein
MPRRTEPTELVAARDVLRANHDAQQDATGAFFNAAARLAAVRREAEALAADQRVRAGKLAELLGVDTAARVTGWSRGRLAEAQRTQRSRRASHLGAAATADADAPLTSEATARDGDRVTNGNKDDDGSPGPAEQHGAGGW